MIKSGSMYDKRLKKKREMQKKGMLTGGQAKIAAKAPPTNKIDEKDFAVLREEKAKGRGMGLQDESVKPGKVMKARVGKSIQGTTAKSAKGKTFAGYSKVFRTGVSAGDKAKATSTIIGVKPKMTKPRKTYKSMTEMREAKGFKPGESAKDFNKRQMLKKEALKAAKATRLGKIVLPIVGVGVAAQQYLKSKIKKKEDKNKKTLKDFREQKKPGIPSEKTKTINSALNKLNKKMGGGMMKRYAEGGDAKKSPVTEMAKKRGQRKLKPKPSGRSGGRGAGLGALGGAGRIGRKEDSSVTLGKFIKAKTDALNESVKAGGMKADRVIAGSNMRSPERFRKNVEAGKYSKPSKDAAYYKSIGLTGKRGDRAVKDFFKPDDIRMKNIMAGNYMGGGMMNKPMGYKSGKSIKVKCKLGKNKPTKMY